MRTVLFSVLFILLLSGCCSGEQTVATSSNIEVTVPQEWDFGEVKEGEILRHNFVLRNESPNILKIENVDTSCGCAVSWVDKKVLKPQESTVIKVEFKTKGYAGAVQQFVYVRTDSIDTPILKFIIKAKVVK